MSHRAKRNIVLVVAIVAAAVVVVWMLNHPGRTGPEPAKKKIMYMCEMNHPLYISDHPGKCPYCGMDLQPVDADSLPADIDVERAASKVPGRAAVTITPEQVQLIGVMTAAVERREVVSTIRAAGRIGFDERNVRAVSLKVGGWIERLVVNAEWDPVHKGDVIFDLYSPDLYEAQRSFVAAMEARAALGEQASPEAAAAADQNFGAARDRLLLWDMAPQQVEELEKTRKPQNTVGMRSTAAGVVTRLSAVQGAYVTPGATLYQVADLSTVWVNADVYEQDLPGLAPGAEARIELASQPGKTLKGVVSYLYPNTDVLTRTTTVRIETPNPEGLLKPGMYAAVSIDIPLGEHVVVDDDAVLDTGERQIVFVMRGEGRFAPMEIKTGAHAGGRVIVLDGLKPGEIVVTSGNFLIDSESRTKAAVSAAAIEAARRH